MLRFSCLTFVGNFFVGRITYEICVQRSETKMLIWLGAGVKVNSGVLLYSLGKQQMVKWFPQYLFSL